MRASKQRIFIKNLPETATQTEIQSAFSEYGTVTSIEIKERKDTTNLNNRSLFFAYVNLDTDEQNLQKCFNDFANEPWCGQYVELQVAKESFLERLKRERLESGLDHKEQVAPPQPPVIKPKANGVRKKSEAESSSSADSSDDDDSPLPKKVVKPESSSSSSSEDEPTRPAEVSDLVIKNNRHKLLDKSPLKIESMGFEPIARVEIKRNSMKSRKNGELTPADTKRLESLNQMVKGYRQQKSAIKAALARVDSQSTKKIVFDNDPQRDSNFDSEGGNQLFDNSGDENEGEYNFEVKSQFEGKKGQKLLELQSRFKNDKRFAMDERFVEGEPDPRKNPEQTHEDDEVTLEQEKEKQFDILGQVLGKTVRSKSTTTSEVTTEKKRMLRFDPSLPDHSVFELKTSSKQPDKKRKRFEENEQVIDQPVVSKDVFYKVSDEIKDTLEGGDRQFSLLGMFGTSEEKDDGSKDDYGSVSTKKSKYGGEDTEKNPFKYDSSDDERDIEQPEKVGTEKASAVDSGSSKFWSEPFFFKDDDYRLQEGLDFLKRLGTGQNTEFVQLRRDLKKIVRAKVRNNQRKNQPFKKKLGSSKRKKMIRMKKALKR